MSFVYKIVTPFVLIAMFVIIYGIFRLDLGISSLGVIIMIIIYFILKKYSPIGD